MQARYMDPVVGRFLSNDPVGFATGGVDYFNRYAYTANDPVNATDPTGMDIEEIISNDDNDLAKAATAAAGREGKAASELTREVTNSLVEVSGHTTRQMRHGTVAGDKGGSSAGVITTGIAGVIANQTGAKNGRFSRIEPKTDHSDQARACATCSLALSPPNEGAWSKSSQPLVRTQYTTGSFVDDYAKTENPGFDAFVANTLTTNQNYSNKYGQITALIITNKAARPLSNKVQSRRFLITPDE